VMAGTLVLPGTTVLPDSTVVLDTTAPHMVMGTIAVIIAEVIIRTNIGTRATRIHIQNQAHHGGTEGTERLLFYPVARRRPDKNSRWAMSI